MQYTTRHKKSKTLASVWLSVSEVDQWEKDNPEWEIACGAPLIHSGTGLGVLKNTKSEEVFKDKLREIDKQTPGNTLKDFVNI